MLKKIFAVDSLVDKFEELKLRLENTDDSKERGVIVKEMKNVAADIPHLRGWPLERVFWSDDAFLWKTTRVEDGIRNFISKELKNRVSENNLDIGCGSYSYFDGVSIDFSFRMLKENESSNPKVMGNALSLPLKAECFDSATMIFVCNYLDDLKKVFLEIKKTLRKKGSLFIIQSVVPVNSMHSILEKHTAKGFEKKLINVLKETGFKVKCQKKNYKKKSFWLIQAASVYSARFLG